MPKLSSEPWFEKVADCMVRNGVPFRAAASDVGVSCTSAEAERIFQTKGFQETLRAARHRYFQELAEDPGATKASIIGMLHHAIQKLLEGEQWDKAVVAVEKLAKIQGWLGGDTNVNVFAGLKEEDLQKMQDRVLAGDYVRKFQIPSTN